YIVFFSRIYNATYLNRYYSNYAMELLVKAHFPDGLEGGVPSNVDVANKYGERGIYEDGTLIGIELHDCGLIYTDSPYFLCVMTKGNDESQLGSVIKDISAAVYNDRENFKPAS